MDNNNCTITNDAVSNSTVVIEIVPKDSFTTSIWLAIFAAGLFFSGIKLFCVDIPRDRRNERDKERRREDIIENQLIRKRVIQLKSSSKGNDGHDLENGMGGEVLSPRECRLQKKDLLLPPQNADVIVIEGNEEEMSCPICWELYKENDEICYSQNLKCSHSFHFECIKPWVEKYDRCPICRRNYLLVPAGEHAAMGGDHALVDLPRRSRHDNLDPNLRLRLTSALEEIRRELIESSSSTNPVREVVQGDDTEIVIGDVGNSGAGMIVPEQAAADKNFAAANRSSNCTSFDTDLSEAFETPSLELEMEDC